MKKRIRSRFEFAGRPKNASLLLIAPLIAVLTYSCGAYKKINGVEVPFKLREPWTEGGTPFDGTRNIGPNTETTHSSQVPTSTSPETDEALPPSGSSISLSGNDNAVTFLPFVFGANLGAPISINEVKQGTYLLTSVAYTYFHVLTEERDYISSTYKHVLRKPGQLNKMDSLSIKTDRLPIQYSFSSKNEFVIPVKLDFLAAPAQLSATTQTSYQSHFYQDALPSSPMAQLQFNSRNKRGIELSAIFADEFANQDPRGNTYFKKDVRGFSEVHGPVVGAIFDNNEGITLAVITAETKSNGVSANWIFLNFAKQSARPKRNSK